MNDEDRPTLLEQIQAHDAECKRIHEVIFMPIMAGIMKLFMEAEKAEDQE